MRTLALLLGIAALVTHAETQNMPPTVEVEEDVYTFTPAGNGAGPMWCHGSTCLVRIGDDVFASGLETLPDAKPLNNCRWTLYKRGTAGWELQQTDKSGRTREPCPLATLPNGKLMLSTNPTLVPGQRAGPARPEILQFSASDAKAAYQTLMPEWDGTPQFTEHSYRSFAADAESQSLILLQNIGYTHAEWTLRDEARGQWIAHGKLAWPNGTEYDKPQPIRVCYPNVALKGKAAHFCGVSDIVEPYQKWRDAKRKITGREWDYDFRRLFYTWCPDLTADKFEPWVEVASRDKTCGWIMPGDMWVAPNGDVHLIWNEKALDERLRAEFYPNEKQSSALNYALLRAGKVVSKRSLVLAEEGGSKEIPGRGRFHVTPDGRLFVFFYVGGLVSENRLMELLPDGTNTPAVRVPLKHAFMEFFTATVRAGSAPSFLLDVLGQRSGASNTMSNTMSYARVRVK
ncbi:MAG TPA: hypothetical protein VGP72_27330 [Planctomycetota bacterium]|jgi:hypothetical protein